jgi:glycosyltransferase involved in cell wall biosynthesis
MTDKILSINIPTYNRLGYLKEALGSLIPQKTDCVEINVTDNHSTDGTWEYLETLEGVVNRVKPPVGSSASCNILSCAEIGSGVYTWVHCDDDIARLNAVDNILRAIREFDCPPVITFEWDSFNQNMDRFKNSFVDAKWIRCNKNEFLSRISYKFTFASAIILRRGEIDFEYVKTHSPTNLIPANMIYSTAARADYVVLTNTPLLAARASPSNSELLTTFTKDMWKFFRVNKDLGYEPEIIDRVYSDSLKTVVCHSIVNFRVTYISALYSFLYSYRFKNYYTHVLPRLAKRLAPKPVSKLLRRIRSILGTLLRPIKTIIRSICLLAV